MLTLLPHVSTFTILNFIKGFCSGMDSSFSGHDWQGSISKYLPLRKKKKEKKTTLMVKQGMTAADKRSLLLCSWNLRKIHRTPLYDFFHAQHCLPWPHAHLQPEVLCYLWITAVASLIIHQFHFSLPKVLWKDHKLLSLLSEFKIKPTLAGEKIGITMDNSYRTFCLVICST